MSADRRMAGTVPKPDGWIALSWQGKDRYRVFSLVALGGLAIAIGLAVFGLPPVDLHGPLHRLGIMGPFCGGTRAAYYTAQGEWAVAWKYNPVGLLAVVGAATMTLRAAVGALTRRWFTVQLHWTPRRKRVAIAVSVLLVIALEVHQQLRAELLMAGTATF